MDRAVLVQRRAEVLAEAGDLEVLGLAGEGLLVGSAEQRSRVGVVVQGEARRSPCAAGQSGLQLVLADVHPVDEAHQHLLLLVPAEGVRDVRSVEAHLDPAVREGARGGDLDERVAARDQVRGAGERAHLQTAPAPGAGHVRDGGAGQHHPRGDAESEQDEEAGTGRALGRHRSVLRGGGVGAAGTLSSTRSGVPRMQKVLPTHDQQAERAPA
jgi:hypothetical protein